MEIGLVLGYRVIGPSGVVYRLARGGAPSGGGKSLNRQMLLGLSASSIADRKI